MNSAATERRDPWLRFALDAERTDAPVYTALARAIAADEEVRALTVNARAHQPHPNLLFGAVHCLLLRGEADGTIRRYYKTLGGEAPIDAGLYPAFREFCLANAARLRPLVETRVTNTNEVGRSALLHLGFRALAATAGGPLQLVEIGPSAGINMFWDRFSYRYTRAGEVFPSGVAHASLTLDCELRGLNLPSFGPSPTVGRRIGLERDPVDLTIGENRDWLRALVWPDHPARLARLNAALALTAAAHPDIRKGDALALLPDALAELPETGSACVYHTIVTYQFSAEERDALDSILVMAGLRRPVWTLAFEGRADLTYHLTLTRHSAGAKESRELALCHPHGAWAEWLVP